MEPSLLRSLHKNRQTLYRTMHSEPEENAPSGESGRVGGDPRPTAAGSSAGHRPLPAQSPGRGSSDSLSRWSRERFTTIDPDDRPEWDSSTTSFSFNKRYSAQQDYKVSYPPGETPAGARHLPRPAAAKSRPSMTGGNKQGGSGTGPKETRITTRRYKQNQ